MLYFPEPEAPAEARLQGILSYDAHLAKRDSQPGLIPYRFRKANPISMIRGLLPLPNTTASHALSRRLAGSFTAFLSFVSVLAFLSLTTGSAHAQSAGTFNKRGQDAEAREDYDLAFEDYKRAHEKSPKDLGYKTHLERMRFLAAVQHIDRGRILRQSGDYGGAISQFLRAAEIDPSNQAAQQEIQVTQREQPAQQLSGPAAVAQRELNSQEHKVNQEIGSIAGPITLKTISTETYTLHLVEDVKVIYQAICKQAGLNVIFDPDYTSKRIPIDLTNVSLSDALRIVGTISGTFYKPITANTVFIAQNTRTKRTDLDELAVQTFYLSNSSQPNDGNEILTGLRLLLDPSVKLYLVPSQNAIVMRATSDQLLLAEKLINDFDRARAEVVVDVAVLEVNRDKIRNLGITLPTSIGLTPQIATSSTTTTSTTATATNATNLTLNNIANLNATDFAVSLSGGTVNALLSDTDTKVLQNPRIRATDGQRATLKIGQKIPVATGSYNAGVSTGVASIGVQTQFTYLDVGVSIDITPTVHLDREVSLKTSIEVSQQNGSQTISGVTEPIIGQRKLENIIQLRDGEPSILAGILTKQDNKSVAGTPGLGEIPFFKFFFSSQNREVQDDEIVFLLIPHIVRENVITRANLAAIDTGTGNSIELRVDDTPHPLAADLPDPGLNRPIGPQSTAAQAANSAIQQIRQGGQAPLPPNAVASVDNRPGAFVPIPPGGMLPVNLAITPGNAAPAVGSTFQVSVMLSNGANIASVPLQMQYNPAVLQLVNVDAGNFLSKDGQPVALAHRDEGNGLISLTASRPPGVPGVSGEGNVATLTFKAVTAGDSKLSLTKVGAMTSSQISLPTTGSETTIHVK